jgi:hypothetical protein
MTAPPPPPTPPGWYPDPTGVGGRRYWDGSAWGPAASSPPPQPASTPLENWSRLAGKTKAIIGGVVVAVILLVTLVFASIEIKEQKQKCAPSTASKSRPTSSDYNPPGTIGKGVNRAHAV